MKHSNSGFRVGTALTTIFLAFSVLAPQAWAQVSPTSSGQGVVLNLSQKQAVQDLLDREEVSLEDFGVETPGLLSSNPFYFMKNLRRSTQRVFVFSSTKKAEIELGILDEKAAELKFGLKNLLGDPDELGFVLGEYELTLGRLGYYS